MVTAKDVRDALKGLPAKHRIGIAFANDPPDNLVAILCGIRRDGDTVEIMIEVRDTEELDDADLDDTDDAADGDAEHQFIFRNQERP